ncbi:type II toxin-antitoxin system HicA family toxin [Pseudomonas knackmussii]|uniref:Type II toxin-antitoxin system HicA family toxin n=1 Tax=Pseudomonas knackmussii TaxID=65741 RepID=A0ABY4KKK5_9PSED|nr:type II toxin-antitoxin system HicA family toxin [Pseudomonas knackmussii]UPQ81350.1 type II toxin-antitoxin system HicA family toxin [Pseudomonas knackmussii]
MSSAYELCHGHKRLLLLIEFALGEGWEVHRTPGGQLKFVKPSLPPIFTGSTARDHRACQKAWRPLRRAERSQSGDRNG